MDIIEGENKMKYDAVAFAQREIETEEGWFYCSSEKSCPSCQRGYGEWEDMPVYKDIVPFQMAQISYVLFAIRWISDQIILSRCKTDM